MRALILFDNSGSMRQNDPQRLSHMAVKLFLNLARAQDAVGLVAFSDHGVPLVPLTPLASPDTHQRFLSQLDTLQFTGQTTDLGAALAIGLASFPPTLDKASKDFVLFLTDGKLDLGQQRRVDEPDVLAHIRQNLLPRYRKRGIALYTIAFTDQADNTLLQEIAQATAGEFRFIESATALHKAISALFILGRQAEQLPVTDGTVVLDKSVQEASLVVSKQDPQEDISVLTPQQTRVRANSTPERITWTVTPSYDLIRLQEPEPGPWQIEQPSGDKGSIAIIGATSLSLQVDLEPAYHEVGEPLTIRAFLLRQGQRVSDLHEEHGLTFRAQLTSPGGESGTMPLVHQGEGIFGTTLSALQEAGQYSLEVTAISPTLQRQRVVSFLLNSPCFRPTAVAGPPMTIRVLLATTCPSVDALTLEAELTGADGRPTRIPLTVSQSGHYQVEIPPSAVGEARQYRLRIRGRDEGGDSFTLLKGPWPLSVPSPPAAEAASKGPGIDWGRMVMSVGRQLLVFNSVLGVCGGVAYVFYRFRIRERKKKHG